MRPASRTRLLTGQTRDRPAAIEAFQAGTAQVFLISLKAGGTGLNLVAADTVVLYDPWWEPGRGGTSDRPGPPHRPDEAGLRA